MKCKKCEKKIRLAWGNWCYECFEKMPKATKEYYLDEKKLPRN